MIAGLRQEQPRHRDVVAGRLRCQTALIEQEPPVALDLPVQRGDRRRGRHLGCDTQRPQVVRQRCQLAHGRLKPSAGAPDLSRERPATCGVSALSSRPLSAIQLLSRPISPISVCRRARRVADSIQFELEPQRIPRERPTHLNLQPITHSSSSRESPRASLRWDRPAELCGPGQRLTPPVTSEDALRPGMTPHNPAVRIVALMQNSAYWPHSDLRPAGTPRSAFSSSQAGSGSRALPDRLATDLIRRCRIGQLCCTTVSGLSQLGPCVCRAIVCSVTCLMLQTVRTLHPEGRRPNCLVPGSSRGVCLQRELAAHFIVP